MNVVGERIKVLSSTDPTLAGRTGLVVLDTANTLVVASRGSNIRIQKSGLAFLLTGSGKIVTGMDVAGRLQDRIGRRSH